MPHSKVSPSANANEEAHDALYRKWQESPATDDKAFAVFFAVIEPILLAYAICLAGVGAAEDLVQETMLRLWRWKKPLDPTKGTIMTIACTFLRRIHYDNVRYRKRHPVKQEEGEVPGREPDPAEQAERDDDLHQLQEGLAGLPEERRAVLQLSLGGLSGAEIAGALNIPQGTVASRKNRGIQDLREWLSDGSDPDEDDNENHQEDSEPGEPEYKTDPDGGEN